LEPDDIPYERQEDPRGCGAAALCMVYRSFGLACTQSQVWQAIARPGLGGVPGTSTWRLAADALRRGLAALTMQVRDPREALRRSPPEGLRLILNHRPRAGSSLGHYSVLVGVDETGVVVHDPQAGPARHLTRGEFLELWRPHSGRGEITGGVLAAIAAAPPPAPPCGQCGRPVPASLSCPACQERIPLRPGTGLGCIAADCPGRTWERVFCPACDAGLPGGRGWPWLGTF
jgi:hypothetical protein